MAEKEIRENMTDRRVTNHESVYLENGRSYKEVVEAKEQEILAKVLRFTAAVLYCPLSNDPVLCDDVIISQLKREVGKDYPSCINRDKVYDFASEELKETIAEDMIQAGELNAGSDAAIVKKKLKSLSNYRIETYYRQMINSAQDPDYIRKRLFLSIDFPAVVKFYEKIRGYFNSGEDALPERYVTDLNGIITLTDTTLKSMRDIRDKRNELMHSGADKETNIVPQSIREYINKCNEIINAHRIPIEHPLLDEKNQLLEFLGSVERQTYVGPVSINEIEAVPGFSVSKFRQLMIYSDYVNDEGKLYFHDIDEIKEIFNIVTAVEVTHELDAGRSYRLIDEVPELAERVCRIEGNILSRLASRTVFMADTGFWIGSAGKNIKEKRIVPNTDYINNVLIPAVKKRSSAILVDWLTYVSINNGYAEKDNKEYVKYRTPYNMITMLSTIKEQPPVVVGKKPRNRKSRIGQEGILQFAEMLPDTIFSVFHEKQEKHDEFIEEIRSRGIKNIIVLNLQYYSFLDNPYVVTIQDRDLFRECFINKHETEEGIEELPVDKNDIIEKSSTDLIEMVEKNTKEIEEDMPFDLVAKDYQGNALYTKFGKTVCVTDRIGEGGEGNVYHTDTGYVAKLFHPKFLTKEREDKLLYQIEHRPHIKELCWPEDILYDDKGRFVGFLMPDADGYTEMGRSVLKLASEKFKNLYNSWDRLSLVNLCINICRVFISMNREGILMGDVNPRNILVNMKDPSGKDIRFVDCDSYQIGEFLCPVGMAVFTNPEMYIRTGMNKIDFRTIPREQEDEDFALAVLLFNILMLNQIPFAVKGNTDIRQLIRDHNFAYPKPGEKPDYDNLPPDGPYELIWNNMLPGLRHLFYSVFKEGCSVGASYFEEALKKYRKNLEAGKNSKELTPIFHWSPKGKNDWIKFRCDMCGTETDMYKMKYNNLKRKNFPMFCRGCNANVVKMKEEDSTITCDICGRKFKTKVYYEWEAEWKKENDPSYLIRCDNCIAQVKCSCCGNIFYADKLLADKAKRESSPLYCDSCNEEVPVMCNGPRCNNMLLEKQWFIKKQKDLGRRILCDECYKKINRWGTRMK